MYQQQQPEKTELTIKAIPYNKTSPRALMNGDS
jgi:hypothetical protein